MIDPNLDLGPDTELSLDDLKQIAQDEDLEGRSKLTKKDDLRAALESLQREQAEDLTKKDLLDAAREEDIEGRSKMSKEELIDALVGEGEPGPARLFGSDPDVSVPHLLATLNILRARDGRTVEAAAVGVRISVRRQIDADRVLDVARHASEYVEVDGTRLTLTDEGLIAARGRMTPRRFVAGVA